MSASTASEARPGSADTGRATASTEPDYSPLLAELRGTFDSGRTRSPDWREAQLAAIERLLHEHEDEFLEALAADLGKPPQEAWQAEVGFVAHAAAWFRRRFRRFMRPQPVSVPALIQPGRAWTQPEPLGVVLVMGAWNYPLQLTLTPAVTALAAGNAVVIKPSEIAPATAEVLARRVPEYLDPEAVRVVTGGVPETTALLRERFDHIVYTGGAAVARIVMTAAARHLTPVTLELGGKSPCIVRPDANLEVAARRIVQGRFLNAGQTCIAPDYLLTDADTEARLLPLLAREIDNMFGPDPARSDSYGRIVNDRHLERLGALLDSGRVAIGGTVESAERYIAPTVLTDVPVDDPVMQEEIFGPVLPIVRAETLADAIAVVRAGEKPLAAYLFSGSREDEEVMLAEVAAGSVAINDTIAFYVVPELPFGGVGESGMGQYKGEAGFRRLSHVKAVLRKGTWPDPSLRYPPYTERSWRWLRRLS